MNVGYILATAARNEEAFIERTIRSVLAQTIKPIAWVIVSNGSTDRTERIIKDYSQRYGFIQLMVTEGERDRNFSSKVNAINEGLNELAHLHYGFIGNLDADIELEKEYFEKMIEKFDHDDRLGLAGGWTYDLVRGTFKENPGNRMMSVAGRAPIFRRECYEEIGGYLPIRTGGEDTAAEVMARMNGWKTEAFRDQKVLHLRGVGTAGTNLLGARYRQGLEDYFLGYHPLYEILKSLSRIYLRPYIIGSFFSLCGYLQGVLSREPFRVPEDVAEFLRSEQMDRIKHLIRI
jgi:biofilm PGA synthesis N-glycosyltransferase PgaC